MILANNTDTSSPPYPTRFRFRSARTRTTRNFSARRWTPDFPLRLSRIDPRSGRNDTGDADDDYTCFKCACRGGMRPATIDDFKAVYDIAEAYHKEYRAKMRHAPFGFDWKKAASQLYNWLQAEGSIIYIADHGCIVGEIAEPWFSSDKLGQVFWCYVWPGLSKRDCFPLTGKGFCRRSKKPRRDLRHLGRKRNEQYANAFQVLESLWISFNRQCEQAFFGGQSSCRC